MRKGILGAVAACAIGLGLGGCSPTDDEVEAERTRIAARGAVAIHRDLQGIVDRLHAAVADVDREPAGRAADTREWSATLDRIGRRHEVDGLLWEGPGAGRAWGGRPLDPPPAAFPPPWQLSFRTGPLTYHHGPFLRALVLGPVPARGGVLTVTAILEERPAHLGLPQPFEARWLAPLGLERLEIESPTGTVPPPDGASAFLVRTPDGAAAIRGVVVPPGPRAVGDRIRERRRAQAGLALTLVWAALTAIALALLWRWSGPGAARWIGAALIFLASRTGLGQLHLGDRFPSLEGAFRASDFGVEDPFGWLASPADFALTAVAFLLAAALFGRAVRAQDRPKAKEWRGLAAVAGVGCAAAAPALWITIVELAVAQGQTEFFAVPSLVPTLPAALMLTGLVAATAAAWLVTLAGLRLAILGIGQPLGRGVSGILIAAAAGFLALLLARGTGPSWAVLLLPLTALPALLPGRAGERAGLPSRVLVVGVLATVLLFPLLWNRVGERRARAMAGALDDLLREEAVALSVTLLDLEMLRDDERLRRALAEAPRGPRPEGLAFEIWLRSSLAQPRARGGISILDADGRRLDDFTLTPLPADRIPAPKPLLPGEDDLTVGLARGDGISLRCVIGRLRVRDDAGNELGTVVLTVPDAVDLSLHGIELLRPERDAGVSQTARESLRFQYAILDRGRVVRSSDPSISQQEGSFGPPELASLGPDRPDLSWRSGVYEGTALWSWERGVTVATRHAVAGWAEAVLALARLVAVGVGLAGIVAVGVLIAGVRKLRPRLHHRILLSYFAISFIPLIVLGWASARDARARNDAYLSQRLATDIGRARTDLEALGPQIFDRALDERLVKWASQRRHDVLLYRDATVVATSRAGLVEAELLPSRLPADAYLATVLEHREIVRREASLAGRPVWFAYAPVRDASGRTTATVGVPLLYDPDRAEEQFAMTGSVLLAAYLLTLVLVLVGGIYAARRLARPLSLLASGTRRVTAGELDVELEAAGSDELGDLVQAFNTMTRELRKATAQAARAEREMAWRRMARQVAHEIKNPLTPIRLMIQQMQADIARDPARAPEAIRRTAPVVLRQIEALSRIAGDFAHFARMPRRTMEQLDVGALARDVVDLYAGSAEEGVQVTAVVESDVPAVRWDAEEVRRVLVNLVGNAVQATQAQGGRVDVRIRPRVREGRDGVEVEVADTGVGIETENLRRIFEPDFSTKTSGTGLGLAIVRRTIDDMGGTIEVDSEVDRGATFRVWWPAGRPGDAPAAPGGRS